jgi:DNA-binding winged helix-turn-helix (wHTH) protein
LVRNRDRVVIKDDLIGSEWGGPIVSDSTLTSRLNAARKAINDSGAQQRVIRTVPRGRALPEKSARIAKRLRGL